MERTCLVTGGSGFVGGRLIELLRQDGWRVRAIGRSSEALRRVVLGFEQQQQFGLVPWLVQLWRQGGRKEDRGADDADAGPGSEAGL